MARRSEEEWYRKAMGRNTDGLQDLNKVIRDNNRSARDLKEGLLQNVNVVSKLTEVFNRSEALQLKALTLGTTYNKFVSSNTKALENTKSSTQALTEALMTGFDQGLRNNTGELNSLIDTMKFQGQNTSVLTGAMAELGFLTGDTQDIQKKLVASIEDNSDTYGVSTEKLAKGMSGLQGQLAKFSLFGEGVVGSFADFKTALLGRTGGKGESQIDTLIASLDPANIEQQAILGLTPLMESLTGGIDSVETSINILTNGSKKFFKQLPKDIRARGIVADQWGRDVINSMQTLARFTEANNKLSSSQKKSDKDWQNTLKSKQEQVNKFYETFAPEMHTVITKVLPAYLAYRGVAALGTSMRGRRGGKLDPSKIKIPGKMGAGAGMGKFGILGAAGMLTRLNPIGIAISTAVAFLPEILDAVKGGSTADKDTAKTLKDMNARPGSSGVDSGLALATNVAMGTIFGSANKQEQQEVVAKLQELIDTTRISNSLLRGNNTRKPED